jgi:hypothetical protein
MNYPKTAAVRDESLILTGDDYISGSQWSYERFHQGEAGGNAL